MAEGKIFIHADLIRQRRSPFDPQRAVFRAGRLMLEEIRAHADRGEDFGIATRLLG